MSIQTTTALPRPRLVNVAILIALGISLAGVVSLFLFMPSLIAHMQAQGLPTEGFNNGLMYGGSIAGVLFTAVICFFISRGNNAVRWVWAVFTAYGLVSAIGGMGMTFSISTTFGLIGITLQLLAITSAVLLFVPVSTAWFRAVKQASRAAS
jgi:hypothetical protein